MDNAEQVPLDVHLGFSVQGEDIKAHDPPRDNHKMALRRKVLPFFVMPLVVIILPVVLTGKNGATDIQ
ncbi:MAG: hypothetical protein NTY00_10630 [Deltaproteobacteria bacterium]|nr:hypothetical protein [Deltaproteobacteria bacterium]